MLKVLRESEWDRFFERYGVYFLLAILFYAFLLRVFYLVSESMWIDETISAVASLGILEHGVPVLESGSWYARSELFHYGMAFFIWLLGGDFGARFLSVLFGVFTVILAYHYGKSFIGKGFGGLCFALLITLSTLEIIYSKQARMYQAFQFFYFLTFYLFYRIVIQRKRVFSRLIFDYAFLIFSLALTTHLHLLGYALIPIFLGVYILHRFSFSNIFSLFRDKMFLAMLFFGFVAAGFILYKIFALSAFSDLDRAVYYAGLYSDFYLRYLAFVLFAGLGLLVALFSKEWKFHLSFFMLVALPYTGMFFLQKFGTRYVYFALFGLLFYVAFLFHKLMFKYLMLAAFLFFYAGSLFSFNGIEKVNYDSSMPFSDFKGAYEFVDGSEYLSSLPLVTTWTPAAVWYGNGAQYWIYYKVTGQTTELWTINTDTGMERFANATIVREIEDLPWEFTYVVDAQATRKLSPSMSEFLDSHCYSHFISYEIEVLSCVK